MMWRVPEGYEIVETDIRVDTLLTRYTRRGVEKAAKQYPALIPSYHVRVERKTRNPFRFDRWALGAYQNELTPAGHGPGQGSWVCHVCGSPRADAKISVYKDEAKMMSGRTRLGVNVRYCNDRDDCRKGAARVAKEWLP